MSEKESSTTKDHPATTVEQQQYMAEVQQFIKNIENTNIKIEFDPHSDEEIQQCITDMEEAIDERSAEFTHNKTVAEKAQEIKTYFTKKIQENAQDARSKTANKLH